MIAYATFTNGYGHNVLRIADGHAVTVAHLGNDNELAQQVRDWLTHQDRIAQLLQRHGLVDVPLEQVEP